MRNNTILFLLALAMAMPFAAKAQSPGRDTLLIGDTTSMAQNSYYHMPYNSNSSSYTQQLILGNELAGEALITGIDLYCYNPSSYGRANCTIYLANTYVENLTSGMVPFGATFQQVAVDSMICTSGWNHYAFDTPFHYNGLGNLIVAFDSPFSYTLNGGIYEGEFYCSFHQNMTRRFDNLLALYTPTSSTTIGYYRNVMRLHTQPVPSAASTCTAPTLRVDSVGATAVRVNWSPGYQDTSWTVEVIADGDTGWRSSGLVWGDTTYNMTGLNPNTHYTFRLTAYCTDTFTSVLHHVMTNCTPTALPFSEDFEGTWNNQTCWTRIQSSTGEYPELAYNYGRSSIYSLDPKSGCIVLPSFDAPIDSLEMSFWAKNGSGNSSIDLFVGVITNPVDIGTFVPIDTIALSRYTDWNPVTVRFENYTGVSGRIAMKSNLYYLYVDDIDVYRYSLCETLTDISIDQVTDTSAVVHWVDSNGAEYYEVAYGPQGFTIDSTNIVTDIRTDSLQLTGLMSYTSYDVYVRPYCASAPANWSLARSFRTLCSALDTLPYTEDFENATLYAQPNQLPCWRGQVELNTQVVSSSGNAHSGSKSLRWWWSYGDAVTDQHAILPLIDTALYPVNTLQISFWAKNTTDIYNLYEEARMLVGVMSDPEVDSTFQLVDTVWIVDDEWRRYDVPLSSYSGTGGYITLKSCPGMGNYSQWIAFLDDLRVEELVPCANVTGMTVTGLTSTSVTLAWDPADSATRWQTYIDTLDTATPQADTTVLTTPSYTFDGLTTGSNYYVWVRTLCSKGDTSGWEGPIAIVPGTWNMRAYKHDTLEVCGISLYDDGGPTGDFISQNSSLVLLPAQPGHLISVSGSIDINNISSLIIYDSIGTSGRVLWSRENGYYPETFGPIVSESGPVTIVFHANDYATYAQTGFELNIACLPDTCIIKHLRLDPSVAPSDTLLAVTWDCNGSTLYQVEYGPTGFTQGTGTLDNTTYNNYTIGGLVSLDHLDVYVRSICGEGDTGNWAHATFSTLPCPDAVYRENFDSTLIASYGASGLPIGFNAAQYSYVQTIIDSAYLVGLERGITALAFHPSSFTEGDHLGHIEVYLANVADSDLSAGPILPDAGHRFVKVIDSANFYHRLTNDWQLHSFDRPFMWDGHKNLLVAVLRNDGGAGKVTQYYCHYPNSLTPQRSYLITDYADPIDIDSAATYTSGYPSWTVGDLRLYTNTCDLPLCATPTMNSVTADYENITVTWEGDYSDFQLSISPDMNGLGNVDVTGNSYTFTHLMPSTTYQIRLRHSCAADSLGYSDWVTAEATTDTFTCAAPEDFTVSDITLHSATFDWAASGADSLWQLEVWVVGDRHQSILTTTHPYQVDNLSPSTPYGAYVRAYCGSASQIAGEWSDTVFFTTPDEQSEGIDTPAEHGDLTVTIAPNPAKKTTTLYLNNMPQKFGGEIEVALSDLTGREVLSRKVNCDGKCNITLNIAHLPNGAYFVRVTCGEATTVKKLIVNK